MKRGVEYRHLRYIAYYSGTGADTNKIRGIMQRRKRYASLDRR
jgi:hypothetical protein